MLLFHNSLLVPLDRPLPFTLKLSLQMCFKHCTPFHHRCINIVIFIV